MYMYTRIYLFSPWFTYQLWYHCPSFATTHHSCEPLEGTSIIMRVRIFLTPGPSLRYLYPQAGSHDRRVVAKKPLLKQPASADVNYWLC